MKLLYAVISHDQYLAETGADKIRILTADIDVTTSYGFESPEPDIRWIFEHCGLKVYRSFIYFTGACCVAVFEPYGPVNLKDGYTWVPKEVLLNLDTEDAAALLLAKSGTQSKTVPWISPNKLGTYLNWAEHSLADMGHHVFGPIIQIKNAYVSSIFRISTDIGTIFLKVTASVYVNSAALEKQLTNIMGGFPEYIAVSPDGFAALMKELPGQDYQTGDTAQYQHWVEDWGKQQVMCTGKNLMGLPDQSPQRLLNGIDVLRQTVVQLYHTIGRPLSKEFLELLDLKLSAVKPYLELLCRYPIPNTICHADIRPGNIRATGDKDILYDWGMAFYGHPFYDVIHFLHVVRRSLTDGQKEAIIDAYLKQWVCYSDRKTLWEIYYTTERCKDYWMLATDCRWVMEILHACGGIPDKGTMDHWVLEKRFYYFDRVLHRFICNDS